jgi:hypothetical protein
MALSQNVATAIQRVKVAGGQVGSGVSFANIEVRVNDGSNMFAEGDEFIIPSGEDLQASFTRTSMLEKLTPLPT